MKKKEISNNQYIKSLAVEIGRIEGYEYWIVPHPIGIGLNGYLVFKEKPVREMGYSGILTYVPVHGGITYCQTDKLGTVYGFDTGHCDSDKYPRCDKNWIKEQCEIMLKGILKAKEVEAKYLRCISNRGKYRWAKEVRDINPKVELNFGEMINILSGKL